MYGGNYGAKKDSNKGRSYTQKGLQALLKNSTKSFQIL